MTHAAYESSLLIARQRRFPSVPTDCLGIRQLS
jgi:hypothetical protein